jgi:hypothetical protein
MECLCRVPKDNLFVRRLRHSWPEWPGCLAHLAGRGILAQGPSGNREPATLGMLPATAAAPQQAQQQRRRQQQRGVKRRGQAGSSDDEQKDGGREAGGLGSGEESEGEQGGGRAPARGSAGRGQGGGQRKKARGVEKLSLADQEAIALQLLSGKR